MDLSKRYSDQKTLEDKIDFLINKRFLSHDEERELIGLIREKHGFEYILKGIRESN